MSLRVALTGATGVLGGAIRAALCERGHEVRALVRPRPDRALPDAAGVTWIRGDLDDPRALDALVYGCDAIVHAAFSPPEETPAAGRSMAEHYVQTNVVGTLRLIERTPATRLRQMVFTSSLAVYGPNPHRLPGADRLPLDEDFPVWPREFYGAHKAALERMVVAAAGDLGMNACALRIGCVLGDYPKARDPLRTTIDEAREHGELRTQKGAYVICADDTARIVLRLLGAERARGLVANVFDRWLDFAELAPRLAAALGRPVRVACAPAPEPSPRLCRDRIAPFAPEFTTDAWLARRLAAVDAFPR